MMISVYGSTGYVGSSFCQMFSEDVVKIPRDERGARSSEILYFISTIHNYNIYTDPHLDINTNLNVLIETLEANRKIYGNNFVFNFISSWFVYGKTSDYPAREDSVCNPTGFYSITKRAAEQLLESYCRTYGIKYRILRLCNVISENAPFSKQKNALQQLINDLANNREIKLYEGGTNVRDFMHVEDVCSAIKLILKKGDKDTIYNVGGGQPRRIGELIKVAKDELGIDDSLITSIEVPEFHKTVQVKNMFLDSSKLQSLGFKPKHNVEEAVRAITRVYAERAKTLRTNQFRNLPVYVTGVNELPPDQRWYNRTLVSLDYCDCHPMYVSGSII